MRKRRGILPQGTVKGYNAYLEFQPRSHGILYVREFTMSKLRDDIREIIRAGVSAPSSDNTQLWRFAVRRNVIKVFVIPHPRTESMVAGNLFSEHITQGCVIENMLIAADHYGYDTKVTLFPNKKDALHTATITLTYDPIDRGVNLYRYLFDRITNRGEYLKDSLTYAEKEELVSIPSKLGIPGRVVCIEGRKSIREIAHLVMTQVHFLFSHEKLHEEFYATLRWTPHDVHSSEDGLDVRTLELNFLKYILFRFALRSWSIVRILGRVGIHHIAAWVESYRYTQAGAYYGIILPSDTRIDCVQAGRILEHMWLVATRQGLSMQPTFATLILRELLNNHPAEFSEPQQKLLTKSAQALNEKFNVGPNEKLMCMFRIGVGTKQPIPSLRKEPHITYS